MPVVSCPQCPTKLRVPDGTQGKVRCPKCSTVFPVAAPAPSAAFESLEDAPPAKTAPAKAAAKPAPSKRDVEFDEDDKPRKKTRNDDDDDDDDRPKKKKQRDDDEDEDDRPRSKRRRDDDDEDRPKKKKKSRRRYDDDDDDEEDWHRAPSKRGSGFGNAKTGMLLLNISFWLYLSSLALITLLILIGWVATNALTGAGSSGSSRGSSASDGEWILTLIKLPGILGLANWIVALVGFAFCIAGPQKARGLAITATSLAGAHLALTMITFNNISGAMGVLEMGGDAFSWPVVATTLLGLDSLLPALIMPGGSKNIGSNFIMFFLAGVCELLRLIFAMLMVKAMAEAAKDHDSAEKAQFGVAAAVVLAGATALLALILAILARSEAIKLSSGGVNIMIGSLFLMYLAFTAMTAMPLLATSGARDSLGRRAR